MLIDNLNRMDVIEQLDREFSSYCLSKHINKEDVELRIAQILENVLKKKTNSSYKKVHCYTNMFYSPKQGIHEIRFSMRYDFEMDLLKIKYEKDRSGNFKVIVDNFLNNGSDKISIKSSNNDLIELKNIFVEIESKITKHAEDLFNSVGEDFLKLKNIKDEIYEKDKELNNALFFNKLDEDVLFKLMNEVKAIDRSKYTLSFYSRISFLNTNIYEMSLHLTPIDFIHYNSTCVFVASYDKDKNKWSMSNRFIKDINLVRDHIDIKKNVNKMNRYILKVLKMDS